MNGNVHELVFMRIHCVCAEIPGSTWIRGYNLGIQHNPYRMVFDCHPEKTRATVLLLQLFTVFVVSVKATRPITVKAICPSRDT